MQISKFLPLLALAASASLNAQAGVVESHLHNIQDRVRACTVLPYVKQANRVIYHKLVSHCPEVALIAPGKAKVKIGSLTFQVVMVETEATDGDVYDIVIREPQSRDQLHMRNVLAFGDVFLGILGGNTEGLRMIYDRSN